MSDRARQCALSDAAGIAYIAPPTVNGISVTDGAMLWERQCAAPYSRLADRTVDTAPTRALGGGVSDRDDHRRLECPRARYDRNRANEILTGCRTRCAGDRLRDALRCRPLLDCCRRW